MMQAARDLIISKEVNKVKKATYFGAISEKRPGGSARGHRSRSSEQRKFTMPSQQRRKKSEVVKEITEEHDIELREQINLLNDVS